VYHKFFYRAGMCMDQSDDTSLILPIDTELCVIGVPCGSFHPHVQSGRGKIEQEMKRWMRAVHHWRYLIHSDGQY